MNILIGILLLLGGRHLYAADLKQEVMDRINYLREHPNDRSHFFINAASKDQPVSDRHTKVHFIVTDSQGRKTGFESLFTFPEGDYGVNSLREIPNTAYGMDQTGSINPDDSPGPESATANFFPPVLKDTYTVQFIGLGNCKYFVSMYLDDINGKPGNTEQFEAYITSGTTQQYIIHLDPTPGTPAPVITKTVTFDALRNDVSVARQLNQLGDDKFADSLVKNLDLAEKLSTVCDKRKAKKENCEPAIAVLKLFVKRLELANRKCDNPADCGEEREWDVFRNKYGMDADFKDFFHDWDKDDWHKHKKTCKRLVTDEALKIITEDTQWLIKSLSGEIN